MLECEQQEQVIKGDITGRKKKVSQSQVSDQEKIRK